MALFDKELALVMAQYPDLGEGWTVQMLGWSIDELTDSTSEIYSRYDDLVNEQGMFGDEAMKETIKQAVVKVEAPKGYNFVRLVKEGENALLLLLKN